jgi:Mrp family chromosome partitioning ATPase
VRAGKTARGIVRSAVESLERIGVHVFGAVLNGVDTASHGYYYSQQYYGYTYTADGEQEKKKQPKIKNPFLHWKAGWRKSDRS